MNRTADHGQLYSRGLTRVIIRVPNRVLGCIYEHHRGDQTINTESVGASCDSGGLLMRTVRKSAGVDDYLVTCL